MPQTREHLDICGLLGITRGVVALTKRDLGRRRAARAGASPTSPRRLRGTFLEGAPIIAVSAKTRRGAGRAQSGDRGRSTRGARHAIPTALVRLPIDRVFSMKGFGTVVTGTLWAGRIAARRRRRRRCRRCRAAAPRQGARRAGARRHRRRSARRQSHRDQPDDGARSSSRAGRCWCGRASSRPGASSTCGCATWRPRKRALKRRARLLVHAGTAQTLATVSLLDTHELEPGQTRAGAALARRADGAAARRSLHPARLRAAAAPRHHRRRRRGPAHARRAPAARHAGGAGGAARQRARAGGRRRRGARASRGGARRRGGHRARRAADAPASSAARRRRRAGQAVGARRAHRPLRQGARRGHRRARRSRRCKQRAVAAVDAFHAAQPLAAGMPREELRAKVAGDAEAVAPGRRVARRRRARSSPSARRCACPAHDPARQTGAARRWRRWPSARSRSTPRPRCSRRVPSRPRRALAVDPRELAPVIELLVRGGSLVRMKDLVFHAPAVDALRDKLVAHLAGARADHAAGVEGARRRVAQVHHPARRALRRREADDARRRGAQAARRFRTGSARRRRRTCASRKPIST